MASHWSTSIEAAQQLEADYQAALEGYRSSGAYADKRAADVIAQDLRAARQYWREAGIYQHAVDPSEPGARDPDSLVKITEGA